MKVKKVMKEKEKNQHKTYEKEKVAEEIVKNNLEEQDRTQEKVE